MRCLTIKPQWAMLIWGRQKTVEIRTWSTAYRGDILITSSSNRVRDCISGHALCVARLVDIVPFREEHLVPSCMMSEERYKRASATAREFAVASTAVQSGKSFAWILEDIRPIKPFPVKGKLNLWSGDFDDQIEFLPRYPEDGVSEDVENTWFDQFIAPLIYAPHKR